MDSSLWGSANCYVMKGLYNHKLGKKMYMFGANSHTFTKVFVRFWLFMAPKELTNAQWSLLVTESDQWAVVWGCCWPVLMMFFLAMTTTACVFACGFCHCLLWIAYFQCKNYVSWFADMNIFTQDSTFCKFFMNNTNQYINIMEGNTIVQSVCVTCYRRFLNTTPGYYLENP